MPGAGRPCVRGTLALLVMVAFQAAVAAKEPVPPPSRQEDIKRVLRELYDKGSARPEALARRAAEKDVNPDEAFVLRAEAATLFAEAGSLAMALEQCDRIEERFEADPLTVRHPVLLALGPATLVDADREEAVSLLAEHALACEAAGRPKMADQALGAARQCAGKSADLKKQVNLAQTARRRVQNAVKQVADLRAGTMDAGASAEAGKLLCLELERWDEGLPLLAKAGKDPLAAAAARDLGDPAPAIERLAMADTWWALAEGLEAKTPSRAQAARRRAGMWYALCESQLEGLPGDVARKRLADSGWRRGAAARTGPALPKNAFDLLGLVDVAKDAVAGDWKRNEAGTVHGFYCVTSRLEAPYELPDEYEMTVDLTVGNSWREVSQVGFILPGRGGSAMLHFTVDHNKGETAIKMAAHQGDGNPFADTANPSHKTLKEILLPKGERRVIRVISQRNALSVLVNDKPVYALTVGLAGRDWGKLPPGQRLLKATHLGIRNSWTDLAIHAWHVKPRGPKAGKVGRRLIDDPAALREFAGGEPVRFGGREYLHFPIVVNLRTARDLSKALGVSLLTIDSSNEQGFVSNFARKLQMPAWVDLERRDKTWVGPDGKPPLHMPFDGKENQDHWKTSTRVEPDGRVVAIHGSYYPSTFICERPSGEPETAGEKRTTRRGRYSNLKPVYK